MPRPRCSVPSDLHFTSLTFAPLFTLFIPSPPQLPPYYFTNTKACLYLWIITPAVSSAWKFLLPANHMACFFNLLQISPQNTLSLCLPLHCSFLPCFFLYVIVYISILLWSVCPHLKVSSVKAGVYSCFVHNCTLTTKNSVWPLVGTPENLLNECVNSF